MTIDCDATGDDLVPAVMTANLHLRDGDGGAQVVDHGGFATLQVGDRATSSVNLFARRGRVAREVAEAATAWADLTEARERGEDVELWGGWVLPADSFGGAR